VDAGNQAPKGRLKRLALVGAAVLAVGFGIYLLENHGDSGASPSPTPGSVPGQGSGSGGPPPSSREEADLFAKLCDAFLKGSNSAEDFLKQTRLPEATWAMRNPGAKVQAVLPLSGSVTLKGRTDHSGTDVAVLLNYNSPLRVCSVILSPVLVVTDKDGRFDLSGVKIEAWKASPKGAGIGAPFCNTCYAGRTMSPPTPRFLIRHRGFDSREVAGPHLDFDLSPNQKKRDLGGLELLPEGTAASCYLAFGAERYPPRVGWNVFGLTNKPDVIRAHRATHPDCPVADDALYDFLYWYSQNPSGTFALKSNAAMIADGFKLFRAKFMEGRDNTGLPWGFKADPSPDGSWGKLIEALEAKFDPVYHDKRAAE